MRERRILSYKYFTLKNFSQGCTQYQEFEFFFGPKDTVHPVDTPIVENPAIVDNFPKTSFLLSKETIAIVESNFQS